MGSRCPSGHRVHRTFAWGHVEHDRLLHEGYDSKYVASFQASAQPFSISCINRVLLSSYPELKQDHESLVSEGHNDTDGTIVASRPSAQEIPASTDAERSVTQSKKPGKKKKGAKGPAAGALAALEELEAEGEGKAFGDTG